MVYGYKSEPITSMILKKLYHKEHVGDVQALRYGGRATSLNEEATSKNYQSAKSRLVFQPHVNGRR
jgi:hypothetical protein